MKSNRTSASFLGLLCQVLCLSLLVAASHAAEQAGFQTIDLRSVANMGWRDEVAGDGKGGWSDQGANDMRRVQPGRKVLLGIPFVLIDPKDNEGESVLVLKSKNFANGVDRCSVEVRAKAASIYFLHSAAWNQGHMATYVVRYTDGTAAEIPIRANQEITNWWTPNDGKYFRACLNVSNAECNRVGLVAFGWNNPNPGKPIEAIEFRSMNDVGVTMIAAVTLSDEPVAFREPGALTAELLEAPEELAQHLVKAVDTPQWANVTREALPVLAQSPKQTGVLLDALAREESGRAAVARAEILLACAHGPKLKRGERLEGALMTTQEVGRRAAELLDHGDPLVSMLADWAMDIRLSMECEGNFPRPWPDPAANPWMAKWLALGGDKLLANDYLRRAYQQGACMEITKLAALAESEAVRARSVAARVGEHGDAEARVANKLRLRQMEDQLSKLRALSGGKPDMADGRRQYLTARLAMRDVVMGNPDLDFDRLLFVLRNGNNANNITQGDLPQVFGSDGEICVKEGLDPGDIVEPLLKGRLGPGHLRGIDLHWNADRVLFSFLEQPGWEELLAQEQERYDGLLKDGVQKGFYSGWRGVNDNKTASWWCGRAHIWEMDLASGGLRQITDAEFNDDYEPAYLPDGDIIFASDRSNYGSQCAGNPGQDKMIVNMHRAKADGSGIHALTNNKDFDRFPRVMDDGTVMFLHWEYQERHLYLPHTLWRMHPDGTNLDTLYKQHIPHSPLSLRHARQIPGENKLMAVGCGHHNGAIGSVYLVDYSKGISSQEGMHIVTPGVDGTEWGYGPWPTVPEGGVSDKGGYYHSPWPLSDKSLLVSYSYNDDGKMARSYALYYIDVWGNKELIHRDSKLSITGATPLRARPVPPVLVPQTVPGSKVAYVYTGNVYEGTEADGIESGSIKYIRVSQHMPWPCVRDTDTNPDINFDDIHYNPSGPWSKIMGFNGWSPARSVGVVPVEEDGSAYFEVPVRQPIYFQALDANFMEVRRMRSMVTLQPGERRGCVGCHETRNRSPRGAFVSMGLAVERDPSRPEPPSWGASVVPSFEEHIQPILDRNCISCHGTEKPMGGIDLSGRRIGGYFQSYRTMFGLKPDEPTPAREHHVRTWHREDSGFTSEGEKDYYKKYFANELRGQLVSIANYMSGIEVTKPYEFGSHKSKLITVLLKSPLHREKVNMPRHDWIDLVTWVDLNAFYHSTYTCFTTKQRVQVEWPNPWDRAPAGEWLRVTGDRTKVLLAP